MNDGEKMDSSVTPFVILGAGSWGTALAIHLSQLGQRVHLWDYDKEHLDKIAASRCNTRYLPDVSFPSSLSLISDLSSVLKDAREVLLAVPSHAFHSILIKVQPYLSDESRILWATKGIDQASYRLFDRLVTEVLGKRSLAVISGPSFAKEVAQGLPTAVSVASNDNCFAQELVGYFNHHAFRVYTCDDLIGVQLGGAIKNVIAIAVGASDGLGYGANAKSALITRGLAEMMRLGLAMGAQQNTFQGLSGLGDLVLTCTDDQSRNRRLGLLIAKGVKVGEAESSIGQVVEGVHTAKQVDYLSRHYQVEMPICRQVYRILQGEIQLKEAVLELLSRPPRGE